MPAQVRTHREATPRRVRENHSMASAPSLDAVALDYFIVDVFTETALAGNPLAVVFDTLGLNPDRMQAIAREFNLSETTFVQRRPAAVEETEGVRVRIFTTQEELPFAGHPSSSASLPKRFATAQSRLPSTSAACLFASATPGATPSSPR